MPHVTIFLAFCEMRKKTNFDFGFLILLEIDRLFYPFKRSSGYLNQTLFLLYYVILIQDLAY